jgi:regulator of cell morphogenesis and NO signaling
VFNAFRVDSCCGGGESIEKTAARDGVDVAALLDALNEAVEKEESKCR